MKRRIICAAAAAAALLAVAGCGKDAGKQLKFGQAATVKAEKHGTVRVAVLGIDKGSPSDLDQLKDSSQYRGKTPYYLHYRLTKTQSGTSSNDTDFLVSDGSDKHNFTHLVVMASIKATGDANDPLSVQKFDKCDDSGTDKIPDAPKGTSAESCQIFVADRGAGEPKQVEWNLAAGKFIVSSDDSNKALATWSR